MFAHGTERNSPMASLMCAFDLISDSTTLLLRQQMPQAVNKTLMSAFELNPPGNRNLLAKSDVPIDFKTELFREKFGHEFGDSVFECRLIGIVTLHVTIIGAPTHPFRLRW